MMLIKTIVIFTFSIIVTFISFLKEVFGSELVSVQEEKYLFLQIMKMSTHPCLTASHRLLFLDWLKSCTLNKETVSVSTLI